ncbi:MAG: ABC transporter permease, partial [Micrococcales bacterium]|nr:ABC transporter permease [Micrococcales bacterium]
QFDLPSWSIAYTPFPLVVAAVVLGSCVVGAGLAAWGCTRGEPAELLRPGVPMTKRGTRGRLRGLSHPARWATRDTMANPVRLFMGVAGVVGTMMLLFAGFGLPDTIGGEAEASYSPTNAPYTTRVDFAAGTPNEVIALLPLGTSPQLLMQLSVPTADASRTTITVLGPGNRFPMTNTAGEPLGPRGVWVTRAVAQRLDLGPGDQATVVLPLGLDTRHFTIDDTASRAAPQGFVVDRDTWTAAGLPFMPTSALLGADANLRVVSASPYVSFVVDRQTQLDNARNLLDALQGIFMVLRVFAVVLTVVVLYSLGSLTFEERRRQYATLKVLGLANHDLRRLSTLDNAGVTVVGLALGIPGGWWFLSVYVAQFNNAAVSYTVRITPVSVAVAVALTVAVSSLTTLLLGRRIKRVDVVEALKGVD